MKFVSGWMFDPHPGPESSQGLLINYRLNDSGVRGASIYDLRLNDSRFTLRHASFYVFSIVYHCFDGILKFFVSVSYDVINTSHCCCTEKCYYLGKLRYGSLIGFTFVLYFILLHILCSFAFPFFLIARQKLEN